MTMEPKPAPRTPVVPMEVAAAVSTERTLFLEMLERRVRSGESIPKEQVAGMVALLREFVDERVVIRRRIQQLEEYVRSVEGFGKGMSKKAAQMQALLRGEDPEQAAVGDDF